MDVLQMEADILEVVFWQVWSSLGKFGQVWTSLDKFEQFQTTFDKFRQVWIYVESVFAGVMYYYTKLLLILVFSGSFLVNLANSLEKCCDEILISSSGPGAKYQNDRLGKTFYNSAIIHLIYQYLSQFTQKGT